MARDELERIEVRSVSALRAWLAEHHEQAESIWVIRYKKHCGERYVPWSEMVRELLCYGWIDGMVRRIDEDRVMQLIAPRKRGSIWSRVNKQHVEELVAQGRMQPAGLAKIEAARADGSWTLLDEVDDLVVPPDFEAAFEADPANRAGWEAWPDSAKKQLLWALVSAKKPATRARRLEKFLAMARRGERP